MRPIKVEGKSKKLSYHALYDRNKFTNEEPKNEAAQDVIDSYSLDLSNYDPSVMISLNSVIEEEEKEEVDLAKLPIQNPILPILNLI